MTAPRTPAPRAPTPPRRDQAGRGPTPPAMPPRRTLTWFLIVLAINFLIFRFLVPRSESATAIPYTLFRDQVTKRNVASIYSRADRITGKFRAPITYPTNGDSGGAAPKKVTTFSTTLPSFV